MLGLGESREFMHAHATIGAQQHNHQAKVRCATQIRSKRTVAFHESFSKVES